ncbi:MAG: fibronectin type III domain-containing protein [Elusimicrobia bacterium]|nr:fibronectin type III domain-containing protein [Elusimicrobiota bacterium]
MKKILVICFLLLRIDCINAAEKDYAMAVFEKSDRAVLREFDRYVLLNNGKIVHSFPPNFFICTIPSGTDGEILNRFGARVYRDKIDDEAAFEEKYGETAVYALNAWNKMFPDYAPEPPMNLVCRVEKDKSMIDMLSCVWNEPLKAVRYVLQIARDSEFKEVAFHTRTSKNSYNGPVSFLESGDYACRVSAVFVLNTGEKRQSKWSNISAFSVLKPVKPSRKTRTVAKPARMPAKSLLKGKQSVQWEKAENALFYRVQVAQTPDFSIILLDAMTDKTFYKLSDSLLEFGKTYYARVMASDGVSSGPWSEPSEIRIEEPEPIQNDVMKPR